MKKIFVSLLTAMTMMSSCTSYNQMNGVFSGSMLGGIFGSSIGGLMDGPRGHDAGQLMGMVIGGAAGAAVTTPRKATKYDDYDTYGRTKRSAATTISESQMTREYDNLSIENLRFIDKNNNQAIDAGENAKIIFELKNNGSSTLYNITPVLGVSDNKRIMISPTAIIASLAPGRSVKYTAEVFGQKNLKNGIADFSIGFAKGDMVYTVREFQLNTHAK